MNPYEILGCSPSDSEKTVKERYRELCKKYHPDNVDTGDREKLEEVLEAWKEIEKVGFGVGFAWTHKSVFSIKRR